MAELIDVILAGLTILSAGFLKGILGIGAPLVAVPILAALYDVPTAIAVMTFPLVVSSFAQAWMHRKAAFDRATLIRLLQAQRSGRSCSTFFPIHGSRSSWRRSSSPMWQFTWPVPISQYPRARRVAPPARSGF